MQYDYRMFPFQGAGTGSANAWQETADQLRSVVLTAQATGWEFVGIEHSSHYERPGCLAGIFGAGPVLRQIDICVFRKPLR